MPKKELVDYIKVELKRGVHKERIKETLYSVGHPIHHVEEAVNHVIKKKDMQNYGILFISIVIVFVVVILSYQLFVSHIETNDLPISNPETDLQIFSRSISENNLLLCDLIKNSIVKEDCLNYKRQEPNLDLKIFSKAISETDLSICSRIMNSKIRNDCLNYEPKEPNQDLIKFSNAINKNDLTLCETILNENVKKDCENFFK